LNNYHGKLFFSTYLQGGIINQGRAIIRVVTFERGESW